MSTAPGPWWSDHVEVVGYSDLAGRPGFKLAMQEVGAPGRRCRRPAAPVRGRVPSPPIPPFAVASCPRSWSSNPRTSWWTRAGTSTSPTRTTGCTSCVARGSTRLAAVSASRPPGDRKAWFGEPDGRLGSRARRTRLAPLSVADIDHDALEVRGRPLDDLAHVDQHPDRPAIGPPPVDLVVADDHPRLEQLHQARAVPRVDVEPRGVLREHLVAGGEPQQVHERRVAFQHAPVSLRPEDAGQVSLEEHPVAFLGGPQRLLGVPVLGQQSLERGRMIALSAHD